MIFEPTFLADLLLIRPELKEDDRGFFARVGCVEEFRNSGVDFATNQSSVSFNKIKGTLRGIHFQKPPWEEAKLVRCERGAIFDVAVDLREGSDTFGRWYGTELNQENMHTLYIPRGFGHAFQTLVDDTQVVYHISEKYVPESGSGIRYDDPDLSIAWPMAIGVMSDQDRQWPAFREMSAAKSNTVGDAANE